MKTGAPKRWPDRSRFFRTRSSLSVLSRAFFAIGSFARVPRVLSERYLYGNQISENTKRTNKGKNSHPRQSKERARKTGGSLKDYARWCFSPFDRARGLCSFPFPSRPLGCNLLPTTPYRHYETGSNSIHIRRKWNLISRASLPLVSIHAGKLHQGSNELLGPIWELERKKKNEIQSFN